MEKETEQVKFGFATVTYQGLLFDNRFYSNAYMMKKQWFKIAQLNGEWQIPVLFKLTDPGYLVILNLKSVEIAMSIEKIKELEPDLKTDYFKALQVLKERLLR